MKKYISFAAVFVIAVVIFAYLTKHAEAEKNVVGNGSPQDIERVKQLSLDILRNDLANRAIGNIDDLKVQSVNIDELNMAHTKVRQTVNEIPVWEGEAIIHLKNDGSLSTITDELKDSISVNTQPNFSSGEAIETAKRFYRGAAFLTEKPKADLWIYRGKDRDHLAYRVQMRREDGSKDTSMPVIFVDAQTGEKVFQYDNLQAGTGVSLYSGTVTVGSSGSGTSFFLEDLTRKNGTFTFTNTTSNISRVTDKDNIFDATDQKAAVDAQYGANQTLNYFQNVHGRNGIDGSGGPGVITAATNNAVGLITSIVHYGQNYNNAYWNGSYMTYGDGDGNTFSPLTTLDICGHEMTHGITERTAALTYANEPGALNEAVSDIFGAMVERYTRGENANVWKLGEQAYTPGNGTTDALRYLNNPTAGGQPDWYPSRYTGASDNGGVHTNSGIANYAFYLSAKGGTTSRGLTIVGSNADDMARVWFRALTVYMTSGTNFAGARTATLSAATDLFGSASSQYAAVANGWCAVGIGSCVAVAITPTPTPTPMPIPTPTPIPMPTPAPTPTPNKPELTVNGGFESTLNPWVKSGTGAFFTANGMPAHSGNGYSYFGVNNTVTGQTYQQIAIPTSAIGTLSFWLNVESNEISTTKQFDKFYVEILNTSGTVLATLATYSNLDKAASGVYSLKTFDVASYKNKTIRLQFRVVTDGSTSTIFRIDDVSVK